jgi:nucleotide-binding universal stress UspA family protein
MIKTVVVSLDGSPLSETALAPARWLASNLDADLHLVLATLEPDLAPSEAYLAARQAEMGIDRVSSFVLPHIFPAPGIIDHLSGAADPLLCMATHGHSGLSAIVLGSVADLVVRDAPCPVVLVGPHNEPMALEPGPLVWCSDGSATSRTALPLAVTLASVLAVAAHIVTVRSPEDDDYGLAVDAARQAHLDELGASFRDAGVPATITVLDSPEPAPAITELATSVGASLIVTATHGHGGLREGAIGRVASRIVQHSACPVVVRRPIPDE